MARLKHWLCCCTLHRWSWHCVATGYRDFTNYENWECRRCGDRWTKERSYPG